MSIKDFNNSGILNTRGFDSYDLLIIKELKNYRKLRGITQSQLARRIGVSPQQIQKYEACKNRISVGRFFKICDVLSISIEEFLKKIKTP